MRKLVWLVVLLGLTPPMEALAGDQPSFFVGDSVQVCNVVETHGQEIMLSDFAPAVGKAWADEHGVTTEYLAFPLIFVARPAGDLTALCGRRAYKSETVESLFVRDGRWYAVAIFEKRFRLKEITGFRYRGADLKQESKLR